VSPTAPPVGVCSVAACSEERPAERSSTFVTGRASGRGTPTDGAVGDLGDLPHQQALNRLPLILATLTDRQTAADSLRYRWRVAGSRAVSIDHLTVIPCKPPRAIQDD